MSRQGRCGTAAVLVTLALGACTDPAPPEPRQVAVDTCTQLAVQQYDLATVGDVEVRELSIDPPDVDAVMGAFEVTGGSEATAWVCTWTRTRTGGGVRTDTEIDVR